MLTWDEINTGRMLSLLHEIVGMSQVILRKKKTLRQSANACIVINELAPVVHLQVV